jgi:hypothetical protein
MGCGGWAPQNALRPTLKQVPVEGLARHANMPDKPEDELRIDDLALSESAAATAFRFCAQSGRELLPLVTRLQHKAESSW